MIIFGKQCVEFVLLNAPHKIEEVYLSKEIAKPLFQSIARHNIKILRIDNKKAQALSHGKNHQGMLARINDIDLAPLKQLLALESLVILCGLSDTGNIGSIIRTAYSLGVGGVIICDRDSVSMQVKEGIFRTSSGALLNLPCGFEKSSVEIANSLKYAGFTLIGASSNKDSNSLDSNKSIDKWALFIGREDIGLSQKLLKKLDKITHIEMANGFNSLNASVAAGILIDRIKNRY